MKYWQCPWCKRVRVFEVDLVMKICPGCQRLMEVKEDGQTSRG